MVQLLRSNGAKTGLELSSDSPDLGSSGSPVFQQVGACACRLIFHV